jgi:hypothetical protein
MIHTTRVPLPAALALTILLGASPMRLHAADEATAVAGVGYRTLLPGRWTVTTEGGIHHYRSATGREGVTVAVYELNPKFSRPSRRAKVIGDMVGLGRALAQKVSGGDAVLSEVTQQRSRGQIQASYKGEEPAAQRRFVELLVSSGCCIRAVYYEAIGLSQQAFESRARGILGAFEPTAPAVAWLDDLTGDGSGVRLVTDPAPPVVRVVTLPQVPALLPR